jgi:hypothetical protein
MYKMPTNLMILNKILIFCESMIEEDFNGEFFSDKLTYDLDFVNIKLNNFWDEFLRFMDIYERDNFLKTYSFTLKRFKNLLERLIDMKSNPNKIKADTPGIKDILLNINDKLDQIKKHKIRLKLNQSGEQLINEEEYSMLLEMNDDDRS